jgi:hypothetical protein
MLTINDLNRNEELSAARIGAVAGGMDCDKAQTLATAGEILGTIASALG